jgi:hypothetical protein
MNRQNTIRSLLLLLTFSCTLLPGCSHHSHLPGSASSESPTVTVEVTTSASPIAASNGTESAVPNPFPMRSPVPEASPPPPAMPSRTPSSEPSSSVGWVINEGAPLHDGPELARPVIVSVVYGTRVQLLHLQDAWQEIMLPDRRTGWVQSQFVSTQQPAALAGNPMVDAVAALRGFYADINVHKYDTAYDRLSFDTKRTLSFRDFSNQYDHVERMDPEVTRVESPAKSQVVVDLGLEVSKNARVTAYRGACLLVREEGEWKIAHSDFHAAKGKELDPLPSPPPLPPSKPAFADPDSEETPTPEPTSF